MFDSSQVSLTRPALLLILALCCIPPHVESFKWQLTDNIPASKVLTFSERYMFATQEGPSFLPQGDSYIKVNADLIAYMNFDQNHSVDVAYAIFSASEDHHHDNLGGMCGEGVDNDWASEIYSLLVPTQYLATKHVDDEDLQLNGTYHLWKAKLSARYSVIVEDWHNIAFQVCSESEEMPVSKIDGKVVFRNPYGFLPGELYGYLPFELARMIAFVTFGMLFIFLFCRHRESVIPLHYTIVFVFLVATVEATTWFVAYHKINSTGEPYCCPFPVEVVAALVLQIFRQTFSRALLLIVALGYGIVRPKMMPQEWTAVFVVSSLYFISAAIAQVSEIVLVNDIHVKDTQNYIGYQVPELFMDVIFLSWIYLALTSTIRILTEFKQTQKLHMYRWLTGTIYIFVFLFTMVALLSAIHKAGYIEWPWQWAWLQQVLWEILNFAVLACVCLICRPTANSQLLAYASQIPTEDPDDDDSGDEAAIGDDGDFDEDYDEEYGEDEDGGEDEFADFEDVDTSDNVSGKKSSGNSRKAGSGRVIQQDNGGRRSSRENGNSRNGSANAGFDRLPEAEEEFGLGFEQENL